MEKALFLYNGCSGKGRIDREAGAIAGILGAAGYRVETLPVDFASNPFDGRPELALVAVAGGDGTVNYVVNRMKERGLDVPLGVIPAGTANDFAGAIGMSHDPLEAARQIVGGHLERIDCGRVNGLYFVNIFSFGLFTTTSQRTPDERKHRLGKLAYILEGVKELRRLHGVPLEVETDRDRFRIDALMMLVFNGETAGGFRLARRSSVRDGLFDCILLEKRAFLRSVWAMARYLLGGNPRLVRHLRTRSLGIVSPLDELTDVDGQRGARFPLRIECLPGELRVFCPPEKKARTACRRRPAGSSVFRKNMRQVALQGRRDRKFRCADFVRNVVFPDGICYHCPNFPNALHMNSPEQINLRKVSISRIKQEMKDVSYLSDDLVITALDALTRDDLVKILTQPKNALVKQYQRMFGFDNVELVFEDGALHAIAKLAIERGTGARGLRSICESVLQDTMYVLPSSDDIVKVIVTEQCVADDVEPVVITRESAEFVA